MGETHDPEERLLEYAARIIRLVEKLPTRGRVIMEELIRISSTSIRTASRGMSGVQR